MDEIIVDSDSIIAQADTLAVVESHPQMVFTIDTPPLKQSSSSIGRTFGDSWVMGVFLILIVAVFLRFRINRKFFAAMAYELVSAPRERNFTDDTIRESAFIIMLNVLCAIDIGIVLYGLMSLHNPAYAFQRNLPVLGICMGVSAAYALLMPMFYRLWGALFLNRNISSVPARAFGVSQSFLSLTLMAPALLLLLHPAWTKVLVILSLILIAISKLLLIFKALRIFIDNFYSWFVFLYYLCSLEIVPLIITYVATLGLCSQIS